MSHFETLVLVGHESLRLGPETRQIHHSGIHHIISYFCSNNTKSRGVAILFSNYFEFKVKGIFRDNGGNF